MEKMHTITHPVFAKQLNEIKKVVRGYDYVASVCIRSLLTKHHLLLTSYPGLAKTTLANTLGATIKGGVAGRIQMLPDTLPADITGVPVLNPLTRQFEIVKGPILGCNVFLADEVNRTSPKTNAGLLQPMQEGKVTIGGTDFALEEVFLVIATRNPIEQEGTYELPEAMIDRFGAEVSLGYVEPTDEVSILRAATALRKDPTSLVDAVVTLDEIRAARTEIANMVDNLPDSILSYIVRLVRATRPGDDQFKRVKDAAGNGFGKQVRLGCSPRAQLAIAYAAAATAYLNNRDVVTPDDVKFVSRDIMRARITKDPMYPRFEVESFITAIHTSIEINA